jgi:hypothetical protein
MIVIITTVLSSLHSDDVLSDHTRTQLVFHVLAYSEMLHKWRLLHKKAQLLKVIERFVPAQLALQDQEPDSLRKKFC